MHVPLVNEMLAMMRVAPVCVNPPLNWDVFTDGMCVWCKKGGSCCSCLVECLPVVVGEHGGWRMDGWCMRRNEGSPVGIRLLLLLLLRLAHHLQIQGCCVLLRAWTQVVHWKYLWVEGHLHNFIQLFIQINSIFIVMLNHSSHTDGIYNKCKDPFGNFQCNMFECNLQDVESTLWIRWVCSQKVDIFFQFWYFVGLLIFLHKKKHFASIRMEDDWKLCLNCDILLCSCEIIQWE